MCAWIGGDEEGGTMPACGADEEDEHHCVALCERISMLCSEGWGAIVKRGCKGACQRALPPAQTTSPVAPPPSYLTLNQVSESHESTLLPVYPVKSHRAPRPRHPRGAPPAAAAARGPAQHASGRAPDAGAAGWHNWCTPAGRPLCRDVGQLKGGGVWPLRSLSSAPCKS